MNTELLKTVCGIDIPDLDKRALRKEPMKLTDRQIERLKEYQMEHFRGFNWQLLKNIEAFRLTYKRQPLKKVCVIWRQKPGCGMDHYFTDDKFEAITK